MSWEKQPGYCPACKAAVAPDSKDCLACGCVFDKWHAKQARESVSGFVEKERRAQAQARPSFDVAPPAAPKGALARRVSGASVAAAATAAFWWLYFPGAPAAAPASSVSAGTSGLSYVVAQGWAVISQDLSCRGGGCVVVALHRDGPRDRLSPGITLRYLDKGPESLAGAARTALLEEVAVTLNAGFDTGLADAPAESIVDGLPAVRIEGRGVKHMRLQTRDEVVMNVRDYMHDPTRKVTGQGLYGVDAKIDPSRPGSLPYVVVEQAEFADVNARKVDGVVLVPLRRRLLAVSYQYDETDAATAGADVESFLAGLRVSDRSRPVDRLGPLKLPAQIGAVVLMFAAVLLLLT